MHTHPHSKKCMLSLSLHRSDLTASEMKHGHMASSMQCSIQQRCVTSVHCRNIHCTNEYGAMVHFWLMLRSALKQVTDPSPQKYELRCHPLLNVIWHILKRQLIFSMATPTTCICYHINSISWSAWPQSQTNKLKSKKGEQLVKT